MTSSTKRLSQAEINRRAFETDHLQENLGAKTISGGALAVGAQLTRMMLQILGTFVLSRLLAPGDFGLLAMAGTVTAFVGLLTDIGLSTATVQRKDIDQNSVSGFLLLGIVVATVLALLVSVSAPFAAWIFKDDRVPLLIICMAATLPLGAIGAQHAALLSRQMKWFELQWVSIASQILSLVVAVALALWTDVGYWALVAQLWVNGIVYNVLVWIVCPWRPSPITDWTSIRSSLSFGLNLTGFAVANYFHRQLDNVLVGWRWGATELGYYSRAYNLLLMPLNLVNGPLSSALLPALSRVQHDRPRWRDAYLSGLSATSILSAGMAALLFGGSKTIIPFVFGPGWDDAQKIFSALAPCMLAGTPMNTTAWIYISLGRTNGLLRWALIASPIYVISFLIGLPSGGFGVALCYTIAASVLFLPCFWLATRDTSVSMRDVLAVVLPPTLVALMLGAALAQISGHLGILAGLAAIAVAGVIYAVVAILMIAALPQYKGMRAIGVQALDRAKRLLSSRRAAS